MRLARRVAKVLLIILVLFDSFSAWQLWRHGLPMVTTGPVETRPGEVSFRMTPAPLSPLDYVVLVPMVALPVALVGFLWWSKTKISGWSSKVKYE
jgi:hypothetical protein